jgi:hypothetical protein
MLGVLLALLAANLLSVWLQGSQHQLAVGFRADRYFVENFFDQEEDEQGTRYRWSREQSALVFADLPAVARASLRLEVGGIPGSAEQPRMLALTVDEQPWLTLPITAQQRRYMLLLPPDALRDGDLRVGLRSATSQLEPDPRALGVRLDGVTLGWAAGAWVLPTWHTLLAQWAIVLAALAGAWRLGLARRDLLVLAAGLVLLLAWMTGYDPFVAATWQQRLLVASLGLLLLAWSCFPHLAALLPNHAAQPAAARAELRLLLGLTVLVVGVRLLGALYPTFDSHDWYIHEERLLTFQFGSLLLFDKPAEFSRQVAIVPPAFYVLVAPLTLLTTNTVPTTQGLYALLDGCSVLLLALFVRQLGGSPRAARLALLVLAFLPIQFTALWWGFGPQVIGQALILLLLVFVAHQRPLPPLLWVVAGVVFLVLILVHNGVALLGGAWLAGYVALAWLLGRRERWRWLGWGAVAFGSALLALLLLYSEVVALQLQGVSNNDRLAFTDEDVFRVWWTWGSLYASFQPLNLLLPLASLAVLLTQARAAQRWLVAAWLASAGAFFAVDMAFGLQVRYAYFVVPLVSAGLGLLLDRLIARHRLGWLVAGCLLALIIFAGLSLWYEGVVLADKPSLRPLTH